LKPRFRDLVDIATLQTLAESLWTAAKIPTWILDPDGEILVGIGWQPICTEFHRIHPETEALCRQSDRYILDFVNSDKPIPECGYIEYFCKNGLIDIGLPVFIDGNHLATVFFGQFFYESPDKDFFRKQARAFGFDEEAYLAALRRVPVLSKEKVATILNLHTHFVSLLSQMGLQKLHEVEARKRVEVSEKKFRDLFEHAGDAIFIHDMQLNFLDINEEACRLTGYSRQELLKMTLPQVHSPSHRPNIDSDVSAIRACGQMVVEAEFQTKGGRTFPIEVSLRVIEFEGEQAIMGIVRDISDRKKAEEELRYRQAFEKLVSEISTKFVRLAPEDTSYGIDFTLSKLGHFSKADRCYILNLQEDGIAIGCMNEWCAPGIPSQIHDRRNFNGDELPWAFNKLRAGKLIYVPTLKTLPPEAFQEKKRWESIGLKSLIGVPIVLRGRVLGGFVLETVTRENAWNEGDILLLNTISEIISNAFERQRDKEALKKSESRFRSFFENSPIAMAIASPDGRLVEVNSRASHHFGFSREEFIGRSVEDITHPDDLALTRTLYEELRSGKRELIDYEKRYLRKDGTVFWGRTTIAPIKESNGDISAFVCLVLDISELKEAEKELREREIAYKKLSQEFAALLDAIPDVIVQISPDMRTMWGNRSFADAHGVAVGALDGELCYKVWHDRNEPCLDCPTVAAFTSGCIEEHISIRPDGSNWELKAIPLKNSRGEVTSVIEIASDITEKIQIRHDAERFARLASLGELSAGIAHEINNPNGLIQMNGSVLADILPHLLSPHEERYSHDGDFRLGRLPYGRIREELPNRLDEIIGATRRISRIVNDLKNFTRPVDNVLFEPFDLNDAVNVALRLVKSTLVKSTDRFVVEFDDTIPRMTGSPQGIDQILVNILLNACHALPAKDHGIFLSTSWNKRKKRAVITLRDEGIGIPPENLERITDPFFTTRRTSGGTGLGLSISLRIARQMNAELRFTSEQGKGTTVTLSIPLDVTQPSQDLPNN